MEMHKLSVLLIICAFSALPLGISVDLPPPRTGRPSNFYDKLGNLTSLQKHVAFFDRNKDGIIFPQESYQGMRAIGLSGGVAIVSSLFINGILSPKTIPSGKLLSPAFPVYVENINRATHNSGTDVFDSNGMFVPEKFEEIFAKYAKTNPDALAYPELTLMLLGNRDPLDNNGYFAITSEWKILYEIAKDKNGFLQKDTIRSVFDGTLFYKLEKERSHFRPIPL